MTEKENELYHKMKQKEAGELAFIINSTDYTHTAINMAKKVIEERGGLAKLKKELDHKNNKEKDTKRIKTKIKEEFSIIPYEELWSATLDFESDYLSKNEIQELINTERETLIENFEANKLNLKRISSIIIGIILSSVASSILLYFILSQGKTRIPYALFIPVIGVNYLLIRFISGIKKLNLILIISNLVAFILSVLFLKGFIWLYLVYVSI